jgi:CRP/FNR family transcriptional regulator, anaerobic regulatory protein
METEVIQDWNRVMDAGKMPPSIESAGFVKVFNPGDVILREESYIRAVPVVLKGSLQVLRTDDDGREILLYEIHPGESCIMSFMGGMHQETSKVRAIAYEETKVLFIPAEKISQVLKESPEMLDYVFRLYHKRFEELLEMVNSVAFKKVDERLLALLHKKAEASGSKEISVTHEKLANELGSARVVVSRLLKQFETSGKLKLGRNLIKLLS